MSRTNVTTALAGIAALAVSMTSNSAYAAGSCDNLKGTWKQSHISLELDVNLTADPSASWTFENGKVKYDSGFGVRTFAFECRDGVIQFHSPIPSKLKIIRAEGNKMVWGPQYGFIYVTR